ncbi:MAG: DNA mismatch endonuclease Vsr [Brevinematales bacterium]|nr:DNA mismatch endonuclease Vsr [Brevinematales bacterium]
MDVLNTDQRHINMSRIRSKNTKPEMFIRHILWHEGYRYRLHYKKLPGKPDIVFPRKRKVIFVNGCFWHRHNCEAFKLPETNKIFWEKKIGSNVIRDNRNRQDLLNAGWSYLDIWTCEISKKNSDNLKAKLIRFLEE